MVLEVSTTTYEDDHGGTWYQVIFGEWIRYPDRLPQPIYVSGKYVDSFSEPVEETPASTTKRIVIDRSDQKLYAYDGDDVFMETAVSTGLDLTPTPRGTFMVYRKTPTRYMQGPLPGISDQYYDLPGVPWDLYFTPEGGAIHGAYWHNHFGEQWSHGCVNLPLDEARKLYDWTPVVRPSRCATRPARPCICETESYNKLL
jgi:lipoprotein-anchoring transpeptidase ErfK/SrfK